MEGVEARTLNENVVRVLDSMTTEAAPWLDSIGKAAREGGGVELARTKVERGGCQ